MVLDVHGGPWGRDVWGRNREVQWLANREVRGLADQFSRVDRL